MVALDARSSLHHVLEGAELSGVVSATSAEMTRLSGFILGHGLFVEATSCVVGLILVELLHTSFTRCGLGQGPSWLVGSVGGVCSVFWGIATWSNGSWSRGLILQTTLTSAITKGVLGVTSEFRLLLGVVLGAWVLLKIAWLHLQVTRRTNKVSQLHDFVGEMEIESAIFKSNRNRDG